MMTITDLRADHTLDHGAMNGMSEGAMSHRLLLPANPYMYSKPICKW